MMSDFLIILLMCLTYYDEMFIKKFVHTSEFKYFSHEEDESMFL
jgi:hypothetical protein